MTGDTWRRLEASFAEFPFLTGESGTEDEVDALAEKLGRPLPPDYREFLLRYGGSVVGPYPIYGVRQAQAGMGRAPQSVVDLNERWRRPGWPHANEWLIVSEDGYGNPIGIANDGRVLSWDHDRNQTYEVAQGFEGFIRWCLEQSDQT